MTDGDDTGSDTSGSGMPGPDDVGSVAEEAAKLLGAFSGWAKDQGHDLGNGLGDLAAGAQRAAHDVDEHLATGSDECTYCPICRTVHVIRELSPEVKHHLASASASLMQAAAALMATAVPDESKRADPTHPDRRSADDIEHIDLEGDDE